MRNSTFKRVKRPPLLSTYKGHMKWVIGYLKKLSNLRFRSLHCKKTCLRKILFPFFSRLLMRPQIQKRRPYFKTHRRQMCIHNYKSWRAKILPVSSHFDFYLAFIVVFWPFFFRHKALEKESFFLMQFWVKTLLLFGLSVGKKVPCWSSFTDIFWYNKQPLSLFWVIL